MGSFFTELVELVKLARIFKRNRKKVEIKVLAALLYFLGLSLRKVSEILSEFESISHEAVRECYLRIKEVINQPKKKERRLVAIDETVIKLEDKQIYV
ncbi:MAG TPA: IS6 family transposase [Archaeoglobus profundus]|nr:IS6 family transposase [Archaeoglobus profundus]